MEVQLLSKSPLEIVVKAIRKCYASEGKSDSNWFALKIDGELSWDYCLGSKDKALIQRIIDSGHTSTIEHLTFTFDIDGLSRAALQELARHRHASLSVKSTRYTLGELKDAKNLAPYLVRVKHIPVEAAALTQLKFLQGLLIKGAVNNDQAKYMLPEAFKTSLIWTINARSLRNFLELRSSDRALWEMQDLARAVYNLIPQDMRFMFSDCID